VRLVFIGSYPDVTLRVMLPPWLLPMRTAIGRTLGVSPLVKLGMVILQLRRHMRTP
jgi:hypothetical protein